MADRPARSTGSARCCPPWSLLIITVTKFTHGAWLIVVLVPMIVLLLLRLNRQYTAEAAELERDAKVAATARILRRHVVLVLVDRLDRCAARAIQYGRTLTPDELRAVHIASDLDRAEELADEWARLGLSRLTLELVDCPDRRLAQAARRGRERGPGRRRDRGDASCSPARLPPRLAPPAPRPHRRPTGPMPSPACPTPT